MRIIASLLVLLGLAALGAGLLAEWQKSASEGVTTPIFARSRDEDPLTVIAWTDTNLVVGTDAITASLIFINRSDKSIRNISVDHALAPQVVMSPQQIVVGDLQPHQRSQVFVLRGRPRAPNQQNIAITYHWTDAAGPGFGTLLLGPVTSTTHARQTIARIGTPIIGLFKDLALPIVLAVGAWLLQRADKRREERRKEAEDERARLMKKADDERALRVKEADDERALRVKEADERRARAQAAWSLMLPESHALNTKYYLPAIEAADHVASAVAEELPTRTTFYWLMSTLRNMRQLSIDKGGLFLKDMGGELVVSETWGLFVYQANSRLHETSRLEALSLMSWREDRLEFEKRLDNGANSAFMRLEGAFGEWLKDDFGEVALPTLQLFRAAFLYEINRPFSLWYDTPLKFPSTEIRQYETQLREFVASAAFEGAPARFQQRFHAALESVCSYASLRESERSEAV